MPLPGPFPDAHQRKLGEEMMRALQFDFERGRLDVSHHPFCGGVPDDTRITTRYSEDDFLESLMAVLHETGHGSTFSFKHIRNVGPTLGAAAGVGDDRIARFLGHELRLTSRYYRGRQPVDFVKPIIDLIARDYFADTAPLERSDGLKPLSPPA